MKHILVVDDNKTNLTSAKVALSDMYKVIAVTSGAQALKYLENNECDLILLDINMPDMDGFEVLQKIAMIDKNSNTPVIFLTGDTDAETENKCLELGAVDFIVKPFSQKVLRSRIARIIELEELRTSLEQKVHEKSKHIEELNDNVIKALAGTIDAKDRYTRGHSQRVAEYSYEIARRMGKPDRECKTIYYAGLLHDVGKIRVPGEVINKQGKLTEEEFEFIKLHPIAGYHIVKEISVDAIYTDGARFHHERYDGKGYPNGLAGTQIPEIARIVGVADAYDAMTSNRSYRSVLPQDVVRAEIEKGKGLQFDPIIADVMLSIIEEDKEYKLKENPIADKHILVVDDEEVNIEFLKVTFKDTANYIVDYVKSGFEAIDKIKENKYDLMLLDIMMPQMDGYETAANVRETNDIPIVLMTADRNALNVEAMKKYGIDDIITKPFRAEILTEILHAVLSE